MKEVERIQQQIRRRLPTGAQISTASLTKDLISQVNKKNHIGGRFIKLY